MRSPPGVQTQTFSRNRVSRRVKVTGRSSGAGSRDRRELRQLVDTEASLDPGDFLDHLLETVLAEEPVLLLFELLAERRIFVSRDDPADGRKEHRVLPSFVRPIHLDELPQRRSEAVPVATISEGSLRELQDLFGQASPRAMLIPEDLHELDLPTGSLEAREEFIL